MRGNSIIDSDSLLSAIWYVQCLYSQTALKELSDTQLAGPKFPLKFRAMVAVKIAKSLSKTSDRWLTISFLIALSISAVFFHGAW